MTIGVRLRMIWIVLMLILRYAVWVYATRTFGFRISIYITDDWRRCQICHVSRIWRFGRLFLIFIRISEYWFTSKSSYINYQFEHAIAGSKFNDIGFIRQSNWQNPGSRMSCESWVSFYLFNLLVYSCFRHLDLSYNRLRKIENLGTLTKLKILYLVHNKITKIDGLTSNLQLELLEMGDNRIRVCLSYSMLIWLLGDWKYWTTYKIARFIFGQE